MASFSIRPGIRHKVGNWHALYLTLILHNNLYIYTGVQRAFPDKLFTHMAIWSGYGNNLPLAVNSRICQRRHFTVHGQRHSIRFIRHTFIYIAPCRQYSYGVAFIRHGIGIYFSGLGALQHCTSGVVGYLMRYKSSHDLLHSSSSVRVTGVYYRSNSLRGIEHRRNRGERQNKKFQRIFLGTFLSVDDVIIAMVTLPGLEPGLPP
jgi:hypothetical protein